MNTVVANAVVVDDGRVRIICRYLNANAISIDLILTHSACVSNFHGDGVIKESGISYFTTRITFNTRTISLKIAIVNVYVRTFSKAKGIIQKLTILNVSLRSNYVILVSNKGAIGYIDVVRPSE